MPSGDPSRVAEISGSVDVELLQIPDQPIVFRVSIDFQ